MADQDQVISWFAARADLVERFFTEQSHQIALLCRDVAERLMDGGRLLAFGTGAAATDAQHVAVEFVHPVIVGKRALPAIALTNDAPTVLAFAGDEQQTFFARQLDIAARPRDVALGMVHHRDDGASGAVGHGLERARSLGLLTIALTGPGSGMVADHTFAIGDADAFVVQELHETLYHVVWELVHVFFEHEALIRSHNRAAGDDPGAAGFLYPFLDEQRRDVPSVLEDVARSVIAKARDVIELRRASSSPDALIAAADAVAARVRAGGRVLVFGNGGSATDAEDLVVDLMAPPDGMTPVPALSLTHDAAVVTAVGNDVGFENVFARQVIAHGGDDDVAVAISTSGGSRNIRAAVEEAHRRGLLTVGFGGYSGGGLQEVCDHTLIVAGDYVPRIQEAQATQYHCLRRLLAARLA